MGINWTGSDDLFDQARHATGGAIPDLSHIRGVGFGGHDAVRAEVAAGGALTGLDIDPKLLSRGADEVADAVVQAVRAAQAQAGQQAAQVIGSPSTGEAAAVAQAGMQRLDAMLADIDALTRRLGTT